MTLEKAEEVAQHFAQTQKASQLIVESTTAPGDYFVWPARLKPDPERWTIIRKVQG